MKNLTNKKVIVRTNRAGVFFGTLVEFDKTNRIAELTECRRLWYWEGAASLSQLAKEGVKDSKRCKFTVSVDEIQVLEVIELIECTESAIENINNVKEWKL